MDDIDTIDMDTPLSAVFALLSQEYEEKIISAGLIDIGTIVITKRGSTRSMRITLHYGTPEHLIGVLYDERYGASAKKIQWEAADPQCTPESIAADIEKCFE